MFSLAEPWQAYTVLIESSNALSFSVSVSKWICILLLCFFVRLQKTWFISLTCTLAASQLTEYASFIFLCLKPWNSNHRYTDTKTQPQQVKAGEWTMDSNLYFISYSLTYSTSVITLVLHTLCVAMSLLCLWVSVPVGVCARACTSACGPTIGNKRASSCALWSNDKKGKTWAH